MKIIFSKIESPKVARLFSSKRASSTNIKFIIYILAPSFFSYVYFWGFASSFNGHWRVCAVEMAVFFEVDSSRFRSAIPPKPGTFKTTLGFSVYSKIVVLMRRLDEVL